MKFFAPLRLFLLVALVGLVVLVGARAHAGPLRVRVRGAAKLVARASRDAVPIVPGAPGGATANELVLSGSLADDAGQPLPLQRVTVRVTSELDPRDAHVAEGLWHSHGCARAAEPGVGTPRRGEAAWGVHVSGPTDAPDVVVTTDEDGRFCFRARVDPARYKAQLLYTPPATGSLVEGAEREITFDLTKRGVALRFDPTPRVVQLDTPRANVEAVAILDDDENPRVARGLVIALANETEELARVTTDAAGRARFVLAGGRLGAPGRGELRIAFAGDGETARASHAEEIERHVKVVVKVPAADRGELTAGVPEEGIALLAEVSSAAGPVAEGSVEARVGEVVVGTAPVERGAARLTATFTGQGPEALVRLRYVPASPWFEPLGEPTVRVPIRGPSLLAKAPILVAGLGVLAFFLVGRVSAQKNKLEPAPAPAPDAEARDGKPKVEVVRHGTRQGRGWTGRVTDAHEGRPVRGVRVWIERGTFEGRNVLATAQTDAFGVFTLDDIGAPVGDEQICAEARLHARVTMPLPPSGELAIAVVQRRRALLAKLVSWARRRGAPFDVRPEATPGHVRRAASGELTTAKWAEAVERAAFGPGEVDARAEQEVDHLAPADAAAPPNAPARGTAKPT